MTLSEFLKIYGFNGKQKNPSNPDEICWRITTSTVNDIVNLYLSRVKRSSVMDELIIDLVRDDRLERYKALYLPVRINKPTNPVRYNSDLIYFDLNYADRIGQVLNSSGTTASVFSRSITTQDFEDKNIFRTFDECATECDNYNTLLYKNTIGLSIKYLDLYCTSLRMCQRNIERLET